MALARILVDITAYFVVCCFTAAPIFVEFACNSSLYLSSNNFNDNFCIVLPIQSNKIHKLNSFLQFSFYMCDRLNRHIYQA